MRARQAKLRSLSADLEQVKSYPQLGIEDPPESGHFFLEHGRRELLVDRPILRPVLGPEERAVVHDVAERPEPLVGKSIVITLLFFLGEPDPLEHVLRILGGDSDFIPVIDDLPVGIAASMGNPGSSAGFEDRL